MPLPVAHGLLGAAIVAAIHPLASADRRRRVLPLLVGALLANAADFDFGLVFITRDKSWHRGASHSLAFALTCGVLLLLMAGRRHWRAVLGYALAFASHGILDFMTTKVGGGVKLLWPFSAERLMLGLVGLSEIPSRMPPADVLQALVVESVIFVPLLLVILLWRGRVRKHAGPAAE